MENATLFIDLYRDIKGFFFKEYGVLDRKRFISSGVKYP